MSEKLLLAVAFLTLGLFALGRALWLLQLSFRSFSWPVVKGIIVKSDFEKEFDDGLFYKANIAYRYEVNGREFIGHQVKVGGTTTYLWQWSAKRLTRRYPSGALIYVRHLPQDPTVSVLAPGVSFTSIATLALAGVLLVNAYYGMSSL